MPNTLKDVTEFALSRANEDRVAASVILLTLAVAGAQHRVDLGSSHERIVLVVPMLGTGTWADPKRPMFAPVASQIGRDKSGILAYYHEPSDDGKSAIVVLVAQDRSAFKTILSSAKANPSIQVFDRTAISPQATPPGLQGGPGTLPTSASSVLATTNAFDGGYSRSNWVKVLAELPFPSQVSLPSAYADADSAVAPEQDT